MSHTAGHNSGRARLGAYGPRQGRYTHPAAWKNPVVGHANLMVNRDHLRTVARSLAAMSDHLHDELIAWEAKAGPASSLSATGTWPAARQLHNAIRQTNSGISAFMRDLVQVLTEVASRLSTSSDHYDEAELANVVAIRRAASGGLATQVQAGGMNHSALVPDAHGHQGREVWNGRVNVTAGAPFHSGSVAGYKWDQVQSMIMGTDPDAITLAGHAYQPLYEHLTHITGQLVHHAETLAENWAGPTAVTAVSQLQMLNQTAGELQVNAYAAGQALSWYGPVLKQFQQNMPQPATVSAPQLGPDAPQQKQQAVLHVYLTEVAATVNAADNAARQRLADLNEHIGSAYSTMPPAVKKNLPRTKNAAHSGTSGNGSGPYGAAAGVMIGGPELLPNPNVLPLPLPMPTPAPGWQHWRDPGSPAPVQLASSTAPPMTSPGGPAAGLSPGGATQTGGSPVMGAGGAGGIGGPGSAGESGGAAGWSVLGNEGSGAAAADTGPGGATGFPVSGAGGAGGSGGRTQGQERERQYWESEEEWTWQPAGEGGAGLGIPGGVITGPAVAGDVPRASNLNGTWTGQVRPEKGRTIWDDAVWQDVVPPVIG